MFDSELPPLGLVVLGHLEPPLDLVPVQHLPEGINVRDPLVLILEVVGCAHDLGFGRM